MYHMYQCAGLACAHTAVKTEISSLSKFRFTAEPVVCDHNIALKAHPRQSRRAAHLDDHPWVGTLLHTCYASRFLNTARTQELMTVKDFAAAAAVFAGLQQPQMQGARVPWNDLNPRVRKLHEQLVATFSLGRAALRARLAEYQAPLVPHVSFLAAEIQHQEDTQPLWEGSLVNFLRCRSVAAMLMVGSRTRTRILMPEMKLSYGSCVGHYGFSNQLVRAGAAGQRAGVSGLAPHSERRGRRRAVASAGAAVLRGRQRA